MAMWQVVVFTPLTLVPALFTWTTPSLIELAVLIGIGFAGTLTQRALARAYAAADATVVLPFEFSRLIFSALVGVLFFSEFPDIWTWVGGAVIFVGIIAMARLEARDSASKAGAA